MRLNSSDYGSGGSMNSSTSWGSQELDWQTFHSQLLSPVRPRTKAASFADLVNGRCTIEDVMQEFRMNGSDAPYNPDDNKAWNRPTEMSCALTPANAYMRQQSWPAPERSPSQRLPRPISASFPMTIQPPALPKNEAPELTCAPLPQSDVLTDEQRRVLTSLPDEAVLTLLRNFRRIKRQPDECRFCKNNGERESYYRSHVLKDASGRVECPVLRAFVCKRCGASGDTAHTIKYCPLSSSEERIKSAAMMRSVRMSSSRRRAAPPVAESEYYVVFGDAPAAARAPWGGGAGGARSAHAHAPLEPLDPRWAALEQKLML